MSKDMKSRKGLEIADENLENVGGGWYIEKEIYSGNGWTRTYYGIVNNGKFLGSADSLKDAYEKAKKLKLDFMDEEVGKEEWRNEPGYPFEEEKKDPPQLFIGTQLHFGN